MTVPNIFGNEILYCGYRRDAETKNYQVRMRYLTPYGWLTRDPGPDVIDHSRVGVAGPSVGDRFIPRDQHGDDMHVSLVMAMPPGSVVPPVPFDPTGRYPDGPNLYEYVRSNPIVNFDPNGLCAARGAIRAIPLAKPCFWGLMVKRGTQCSVCPCGLGEPFRVYTTVWGRCGGAAPSCPTPNLPFKSCCTYWANPNRHNCGLCCDETWGSLSDLTGKQKADAIRTCYETCMCKHAN